jgi:serpin B
MTSRTPWHACGSLLAVAMTNASALGCSSAADRTSEARSNLSRDLSPGVSSLDQGALEGGNAAFAFDSYGVLRGSPGNLVFSPYSLSTALAMSYAGARGRTADEIANALHFTLPASRLHPAFDWLDLQLASRADQPLSATGRPFALKIANSLWDKTGDHVEKPFLDTLAVNYGAGLKLVNFGADPAGATAAINGWTGEQTNGRILNLLPPGAVDTLTHLVLVDALYFDAAWMQPFDRNQTRPGTFTRLDGSTLQATMMWQASTRPYASGPGYQAVELTYEGGLVALDIVLPMAGTETSFETGLNAQMFASLVGNLQPTTLSLTMPKFHVAGASVSVAAMLAQLGIHAAFDPGLADFTGIVAAGGIFIKDVFHKAFVAVDEDGTEAAAASAVIFEDAGIALNQVELVLNHPFFFAIRDLPTGTILFMGRINDPSGS